MCTQCKHTSEKKQLLWEQQWGYHGNSGSCRSVGFPWRIYAHTYIHFYTRFSTDDNDITIVIIIVLVVVLEIIKASERWFRTISTRRGRSTGLPEDSGSGDDGSFSSDSGKTFDVCEKWEVSGRNDKACRLVLPKPFNGLCQPIENSSKTRAATLSDRFCQKIFRDTATRPFWIISARIIRPANDRVHRTIM